MEWFLYDRDLRRERVKDRNTYHRKHLKRYYIYSHTRNACKTWRVEVGAY